MQIAMDAAHEALPSTFAQQRQNALVGRVAGAGECIACGGGKNGSGSHANFAVANSQAEKITPSTSSHGAR